MSITGGCLATTLMTLRFTKYTGCEKDGVSTTPTDWSEASLVGLSPCTNARNAKPHDKLPTL